jgi:hypothetical protein
MAQIYTIYASSAAAANTFARSIVAAMFPVITHMITDVTGTKWAGQSTNAFLSSKIRSLTDSAICLSLYSSVHFRIPIARTNPNSADLHSDGKQLRARSRYGQEARVVITRMGEYNNGGSTEVGSENSPATKQEVHEPEKASA